jgi:dienelactone hydrolase
MSSLVVGQTPDHASAYAGSSLDQDHASLLGEVHVDVEGMERGEPREERLDRPDLLAREHTHLQRVIYAVTRPLALFGLYRGYFTPLYGIAGVRPTIEAGKELLLDLGGEPVRIPTPDGSELSAMYFSADHFRTRADEVYRKWKPRLEADPRLTSYMEADLAGRDLRELMRLPISTTEPCHLYKTGSVRCLGAGCIFEVNPQAVLQNLYRGVDHLAFNYRGINESSGSPTFEHTCEDAVLATRYMQERLHCTQEQLLEMGTSLGGGPAIYAGTQIPGLDVVVDRSFSRLGAVRVGGCLQSAFRYLADTFYPYPSEDWIGQIPGRVCVIHAREDSMMEPEHAERLVAAYARGRLGEAAEDDATAVRALRDRSYFEAAGGHNSRCGGDENYSWFADDRSQQLYTRFLKNEPLAEPSDLV